jgi:hypothetical protein
MRPVYEGNPKHKAPWQPGRKGSLCPPDVSLERARELLQASVLDGRKRYAVDGGRAFCAQQHDAEKNRWHGYPIAWREVPGAVVHALLQNGAATRRDVKRYWEKTE